MHIPIGKLTLVAFLTSTYGFLYSKTHLTSPIEMMKGYTLTKILLMRVHKSSFTPNGNYTSICC